MTKVLIIGATGYLGRRLAEVLVRHGRYQVYGIARTNAKAESLAVAEITPVLCTDPVNDPSAYVEAIRNHQIDTIVDVGGANADSAKFLEEIKKIGKERLESCLASGYHKFPKPGFIYCSGTWVHGSAEKPVDDLDVVGVSTATPPRSLVAWRVELEKSILASTDILDVAILRPALIYGYEGTIWTPFFLPLLKAARSDTSGSIQVPLTSEARPGLIHVDDVATGFEKAIEKLSLINGGSVYPIFDLVTSQESMSEIFTALASNWKYQGRVELVGPGDDLFAEATSTTMRGSSARAKQLLGWEPKRLDGYVADMDRYAAAFASRYGNEF
ncbi:NAD(P)-binding protein [Periconia macrospinosa]|uniref:NAD(P)-binding protein n=1 Tax=Periconia macrospinosa TaxID=97972 RepID=A0A2V1DAS5_9PLEO|nr:NAD(P)-binding protein [Periconia macrospinosa]